MGKNVNDGFLAGVAAVAVETPAAVAAVATMTATVGLVAGRWGSGGGGASSGGGGGRSNGIGAGSSHHYHQQDLMIFPLGDSCLCL